MDENDFVDIYYLILLRQYGYATTYDLNEMERKIFYVFRHSRDVLKSWLALHGILEYEEFVKEWKGHVIDILHRGGQYQCGIMLDTFVHDNDYDEDFLIVDNGVTYFSLGQFLREGLKPLYNDYRKFYHSESYPIVSKMQHTHDTIVKILNHPEDYNLSNLIIEFDNLVDLYHTGGRLLDDYIGVNVEMAKSIAERKFIRQYGYPSAMR